MLRLVQQHMTTFMKPFIGHVDQLFTAVESLSSDLAVEQARSRKHREEISLRLFDIDKKLTSRRTRVANAVEEQQDCDVVVQAQLDQWFAEVLEPMVHEQNDRQTDRQRSVHGKMQALLTSLLQPAVEQHQETIRGHLDSFSSRLSVAEAVAEKAASSLQEQSLFTSSLGGAVGSALKNMCEAQREIAVQLTGTGRIIMAPATEEQPHNVSELESLEQNKLRGIRGRFEKVLKTLDDFSACLAATNGRVASNLASTDRALVGIQLALQERTPLSSPRIVAGSVHAQVSQHGGCTPWPLRQIAGTASRQSNQLRQQLSVAPVV
jgi:hypothetical protein